MALIWYNNTIAGLFHFLSSNVIGLAATSAKNNDFSTLKTSDQRAATCKINSDSLEIRYSFKHNIKKGDRIALVKQTEINGKLKCYNLPIKLFEFAQCAQRGGTQGYQWRGGANTFFGFGIRGLGLFLGYQFSGGLFLI